MGSFPSDSPRRTSTLALALFTLGLLGAACAPASPSKAATGRVYALGGADGRIIELAPGRRSAAPVAAGQGISGALAMVAGPGRTLVLLTHEEGRPPALVQLDPSPGGKTISRVSLPSTQKGAVLAAGGAYAAVLYQPAGGTAEGSACRLMVVALEGGSAQGKHPQTGVVDRPLCDDGELAGRVRLAQVDGRVVVYVTTLRYRAETGEAGGTGAPGGGGRLLALDAASAATVAAHRLAGSPGPMAVVTGDNRGGRNDWALCLVEDVGAVGEGAEPRSRLLALDPLTLDVTIVQDMHHMLRALAPDANGRLVALRTGGREVRELDLRAGTDRPLAKLPGEAVELLVDGGEVLAAGPGEAKQGGGVWVVDGRSHRVSAVLRGGSPIALATHLLPFG